MGHGNEPVLYQHASVHDVALGHNIVGPSIRQPCDSRSFQHLATQFTNDEFHKEPATSDGNRSHPWLQQQESIAGEQSWGHGDPASANYTSASNYQVDTTDAMADWNGYEGYSHQQGGTSSSTMHDQSGNQGLMNSSMQTSGYHHREDAMIDGQIIQDGGMISHNNFDHTHSFDPGLLNMGGVDAEAPPWSAYHTANMHSSPYFLGGAPVSDSQDTSEMTLSTTDQDGSGSVSMSNFCTLMSSTGYGDNSMIDSGVTERPSTRYPSSMDLEHIPPDSPPSFPIPYIDIGNYVASTETPSMMEDPSRCGGNLLVPMSRSLSTRSSVSNASSAGPPPTNDPEIMYCEIPDCRQPFTGLYRRGNLGRHRRLVHGTGKPYVCEDGTCAKEFRRQDARLKHYRKYHPELAAHSPIIRRSSASRPMRRSQEVELSNMSGWAA